MKKGGTEYLVSIHEYKVEVMPLLQYQLNKDACLLIAASLQLIALYQLTKSDSQPYLTLIELFDGIGWWIRQNSVD